MNYYNLLLATKSVSVPAILNKQKNVLFATAKTMNKQS